MTNSVDYWTVNGGAATGENYIFELPSSDTYHPQKDATVDLLEIGSTGNMQLVPRVGWGDNAEKLVKLLEFKIEPASSASDGRHILLAEGKDHDAHRIDGYQLVASEIHCISENSDAAVQFVDRLYWREIKRPHILRMTAWRWDP